MMSGVQHLPAVSKMLEDANRILGWNLLELCLEGPESKLEETKYCQSCMFVAGLAGIEKLRADNAAAVEGCSAVAGLSLGEYTALCHAGVFSFEDGLRLVQLRGELMQEAVEQTPQAMVSIAGLEIEKVELLCKEAKQSEDDVCVVANQLFPKGVACGGTKDAIARLQEAALKNGAMQAKLLKTSGGFHTSLMAPARAKLEVALEEALPRMRPPEIDVYVNVTGKVLKAGTNPQEVCKLLGQQLTSRVLWEGCVRSLIQAGITEFYEAGPMKQLKAMMKRIDPKMANATTSLEV
jgi:[acyl-carrier-protein] S-malonyltransferase